MRNFNTYGFITLFGILFLIVLYKVLHVPVTCDELPTVSYYSNFSFWEIMMYPDNIPNNHILNTLLSKCCIIIFGKEQWAIRLPNLLSFVVFSVAVFQILKLIIKLDSYFFLCVAVLFVNPYLLDFFGICRGYGISSTWVTVTAGLLLAGFSTRKSKYIWFALFASILASYANFTVLVFWAATTIIVWFYVFIENINDLRKLIKPTFLIFIVSVAYLALILVPIQKMQSSNEFQYWTSRGFYDETVKSMIINWQYDSEILTKIKNHFLSGIVGMVVVFNIAYLINLYKRRKYGLQIFYHPVFIATIILLLSVCINLVQTKLLGTPNLSGRTAVFFFPLVSLVFAVLFSIIPEFRNQWINKTLAIVLGIVFVTNFAHRESLKSIKEWSFDQNNMEVINYLKDRYNEKPISLKTCWFFHPSFTFYVETGKSPWIDLQPYDYKIDVTTPSEYYYIFAEDYKTLEPRFEVVYKFSPDRWLLKQKSR